MKTTKGSIQQFALVAVAACVGATYVAPARAQVCEPVKIGTAMKYRANPPGAPPVDTAVVQQLSAMRYLRNTAAGALGTTWTAELFDDSGWTAGTYGVGYDTAGLPNALALIQTSVPPGALSIYTRATFSIADASKVRTLSFGADHDDGYVVWINGVEVARSDMPVGAPNGATNAAANESSNGLTPNYTFSEPLVNIGADGVGVNAIPLLHNGTNVMAVGVWNNGGAGSTDLVIVPQLSIGFDWTTLAYNDAAWSSGFQGVGYDTTVNIPANATADALFQTPEVATNTLSIHTRATFNVANPAAVTNLTIGADYDDGFAAYINGVEVFRSVQLPGGALQHNTSSALGASAAGESSNSRGHCSIATTKYCDENGLDPTNCTVPQGTCVLTTPPLPNYGPPIDVTGPGLPVLVAGANVFAVGVWNSGTGSSDLVLVPDLKVTVATDSVCNGIDDDCDLSIDEDFVSSGTTCGVGACAATGTSTCVAGVIGSNCTPGTPGTELNDCNGIDEDCNGIDNGCPGSFALVAKAFSKTVAGTPVPMWGFALDTGGDCVSGPETPTVPGPRLTVPVGSLNLSITLRNCLTDPISLVIPQLGRALDPTFLRTDSTTYTGLRDDLDVTSRIRSFDTEIAPGGSHLYTWTVLRPGTFLYHSGSHPALQVPMGLYGALSLDYAAGEAYPGVPYDNEALLIYSEIDPTRPFVPSTLGYAPAYFLVNGEPYPAADPGLDHSLAANERVLLRFVNAGLQNHVPTFLGSYLMAVAEDAHPYPYARDQYGVLLPAGKTLDAMWTANTCSGSVPLFDRRLWLSNPGVATPGGMLVTFGTTHDGAAPVAADDPSYTVVQGNTLVVAAPGILGNDTSPDPMTAVLVAGPANGTLLLDPNGSFRYTPDSGFSGVATFTYKANDCEDSNVATVTVTVTPETLNLAPIGAPDIYAIGEDGHLVVVAPGVLGNDNPTDGGPSPMTAVLNSGVGSGTLILGSNGSVDYTPSANYNGPDSFTYRAFDGQLYSAVTTVSLSVTAVNDPPVANDDTRQTRRTTPVAIPLLANDTDVDNAINAATRTIVVAPLHGTLVLNAGGAVTYTASAGFLGTDTFTYTVRDVSSALSNQAVVRVNVTK
jgi:FtsP/CotA-like multicopper oxidase with cupredoxin domain